MSIDDYLALDDNPIGRIAKAIRGLPVNLQSEAVERLVIHEDADTRAGSLLVVERIGHPNAPALCRRLLADPVWYVRMRACEYAERHRLTGALDLVLRILESDENEDARATAAVAVGTLASKENVPLLESLVRTVTGNNHEGTPVKSLLKGSIEQIRTGRVD
jgi:HEAT repeat protein